MSTEDTTVEKIVGSIRDAVDKRMRSLEVKKIHAGNSGRFHYLQGAIDELRGFRDQALPTPSDFGNIKEGL